MSDSVNSLNKSFATSLKKHKPVKKDVQEFQLSLSKFVTKINPNESEEHNKNWIVEFLNQTFYSDNSINTYKRKDLAIYSSTNLEKPEVLIEAKKPLQKAEMPTKQKLDSKALQELLYYFLEETIENKNLDLKNLIITDCYDWFIFDALEFNKVFEEDKELIRNFKSFKQKSLIGDSTADFYTKIASPAIQRNEDKLIFTFFNLNPTNPTKTKITDLYKLFSPYFLLKKSISNDSNQLNKSFYYELLHIMGLEEKSEGGKKLIGRKVKDKNRGSLLENAIAKINSGSKLTSLKNLLDYGKNETEQTFNIALELV
jgi:hypothetical protein